MTISVVWTLAMVASILYSCYAGTTDLLTPALTEGIRNGVSFCLDSGCMMVFWCGLFAVMEASGLANGLTRLLRPLLQRLFPLTAKDKNTFSCLAANVSANLLGLGNAATPMGVRTAQGIAAQSGNAKELACLVVMNTASIQLLPTTVASVRAGLGCSTPMDILPCVLLTSLLSVSAGLLAVHLVFPHD